MLGAIREAKVGELVLSTVSTLASVAYGKLESKELDEAKRAIDAIDALLPLLEGEIDERGLRSGARDPPLAYARRGERSRRADADAVRRSLE